MVLGVSADIGWAFYSRLCFVNLAQCCGGLLQRHATTRTGRPKKRDLLVESFVSLFSDVVLFDGLACLHFGNKLRQALPSQPHTKGSKPRFCVRLVNYRELAPLVFTQGACMRLGPPGPGFCCSLPEGETIKADRESSKCVRRAYR